MFHTTFTYRYAATLEKEVQFARRDCPRLHMRKSIDALHACVIFAIGTLRYEGGREDTAVAAASSR